MYQKFSVTYHWSEQYLKSTFLLKDILFSSLYPFSFVFLMEMFLLRDKNYDLWASKQKKIVWNKS